MLIELLLVIGIIFFRHVISRWLLNNDQYWHTALYISIRLFLFTRCIVKLVKKCCSRWWRCCLWIPHSISIDLIVTAAVMYAKSMVYPSSCPRLLSIFLSKVLNWSRLLIGFERRSKEKEHYAWSFAISDNDTCNCTYSSSWFAHEGIFIGCHSAIILFVPKVSANSRVHIYAL